MATISLTKWLSDFTTASYDDVTGNVTLNVGASLTSDERVIINLINKIITSANGKRVDLDSPISELSFNQDPSLVNRSNATNTVTELQVEKPCNLSTWFIAPDLNSLNPVNDND